jgi:hypothetical protein
VLYFLDANGEEKNSNDDWEDSPQSPHSDCNYNSRIITSNLSNGIYTLVAGTYYEGESDNFVISVRSAGGSFNLEKSDSEETKSISSDCSGEWKSSGGKNYKSNRNPNFDLIVTAKEKVTINLSSSIDTYLYLLSNDGLKAKNDDIGNGNYNSRILEELTPGSYKLVAATWGNNQTGNFDLTVTSTDGKSKLKCSPGDEDEGEGGNSSQPTLSLGEDVTITWSSNSAERFYQSQATDGSINLVYTSSNSIDFPVDLRSGEVRYTNSGSVTITASHIVNGIEQTAQYRLTVEKADQQPLESIERITETFAPDLEFIPRVSGGSTNNKVTFERMAGPDNIVRFQENFTKLKIEGVGTVVIRAKKAGNENYNDVFHYFWLTVNKAQPWIEIEGITNDKFIKNGTSGEIDIKVNVGIGQGQDEKTIEVNKDEFAFDYTNNTQQLFSPVKIQNSKIMAKKIGRASIKVSVPESANYFGAEKEFVLEVRPNNVKFDQNNLSNKSITKQCGESVDIDLMIDDKPLAQALQNTGSSDDILVFASSQQSVAEVNSQNGEVDLVGTGTTTISATFFGDSKLKDSYNLTVNKVVQPIEFEETGPISIYGDEISNNSINNPIKGDWPDGSITYSIEQSGELFNINSRTGEVTLDSGSELPVTYSATIVAETLGDSCYQAASASYTINLYNAVRDINTSSGITLTPDTSSLWFTPGQTVSFAVNYNYGGSVNVPYLSLGIFYNSNDLEIDEDNVHSIFGENEVPDTYLVHFSNSDTEDRDGDKYTDSYIKIVWSEDLGDNFIGSDQQLPLTLFKVNAVPKSSFSGITTIKLVNLPEDTWYSSNNVDFSAVPVTVASSGFNIPPKLVKSRLEMVKKTAAVGKLYTANIQSIFTDPKDTLTYTLSTDGNPASEWLRIDDISGAISGKPEAEHIGSSTVTITAKDSDGQTVSGSFELTVFKQTVHVGQQASTDGSWEYLDSKKVLSGESFVLPIIHDFSGTSDKNFGVRIHYDSSKLKFDGVEEVLRPFFEYTQQARSDKEGDYDGISDTDKYIFANWDVPDLSNPSTEVLLKLRFTAVGQFSDSVISFTNQSRSSLRSGRMHGSFKVSASNTDNLSPKIIMVTGAQKDVDNNLVEVSLEYDVSDGATNHQYLNVHMHYDSEKLTWIGFDTNTALGIHDKYKSPNNNILEKLNDYEFGELNLVGDYPVSSFTSAGTDFGEINTDRLIYLKWGWNFNSRNRTYNVPLFSSEMGFTGNNQLPVALIKGYFVRKDGFDSGTTKITFTNAKPAEGNPSASYEFKSSSLIIEANPNTSNSDNSGG